MSPRLRSLLAIVPLAACGGADEHVPAAVDAAAIDAASCEPGATVTGSIGPGGGELALCGARLAVAAGVLATAADVTIAVVEPPAPLPFERIAAGAAFAFDASVDPLPGLVSIDVPAAPGDGYLYLYRHDGDAWWGLEACRVDGGIIGQDVGVLGTYVALRDTEVYPPSPDGLGEGTVDVTLDGVDRPFTLDASSRGIYQDGPDGGRAVTLYLWYTPPGGMLEVLDLTFAVPARGAAEIIAASWIALDGPDYSYLAGLTGGSATITLDPSSAGERYVGAVEVTFVDNDGVEHLLTADLDVTVEEYVFPPELACPGGPKG